MASARQHGSDDEGDRARTCRRRRSHLPLGAEKTLSEAIGGARQGRNAFLLHHAGAHRSNRSVQSDRRVCRQRADAVRARRMDPRRQGGVRTVRQLYAAPGAEFVALRRQAHAARAHRVDRDARSRHRLAALQNGEVDWWETPIADILPVLKRNRNVVVDIADPLGNIGSFRMNHLHPPFNDVRARRAILTAMSQEDYMRAVVGDDALWKPLPSFFTPGTPLYSEDGGEILKGPRRLDAAKRLLADSGYAGQPVTCVVAQDLQITKAQGEVTADLLRRLGMNVDFAAVDWGTNAARRAQKSPPGQGGWQMFHTWHAGAVCIDPSSYAAIRANGDKAWFGWPTSAKVEAEITAWYEAKNLD